MATPPSSPLVSVIIPAFNYAHMLATAVDSALAQTYVPLEVLVIDDGSTDATPDLLASYGDRIRAIRQPNAGLAAARNRGIREALGTYLAFLDADDYWAPAKTARQVEVFRSRPGIGLVDVRAHYLNYPENTLRHDRQPALRGHRFVELLRSVHRCTGLPGSGSGVMITREVMDTVGYFDETLQQMEDYDYWLRAALHFELDYVESDEPLTFIRRHHDSMSHNLIANWEAATTVVRRLQQRPDLPPVPQEAWDTALYLEEKQFRTAIFKYKERDFATFRGLYLDLIRHHPSWAWNLSHNSALVKSLLGPTLLERLRRLMRHGGHR